MLVLKHKRSSPIAPFFRRDPCGGSGTLTKKLIFLKNYRFQVDTSWALPRGSSFLKIDELINKFIPWEEVIIKQKYDVLIRNVSHHPLLWKLHPELRRSGFIQHDPFLVV